MNNNDNPYRAKPITLYVSSGGVLNMNLEHIGVEVEQIIDVELSEMDAVKLKDMLISKLNVEVWGTVTFRLKGRLVT